MKPHQLSLPVTLRDQARFASFYSPASWSQHQARVFLERSLIPGIDALAYLWGADAGATHLLHATCNQLQDSGTRVQYLSLPELLRQPPTAVCADLEQFAMVCIDNVQAIAGHQGWEEALFDLYNRIRDAGGRLLVAANCSPRELPVQLADLRSRLSGGSIFHLTGYDDEQRVAILRFRASGLGLDLGAEAARFILHRAPRELAVLMSCLRHLDRAALDSQRRPTVPFLKEVFGW